MRRSRRTLRSMPCCSCCPLLTRLRFTPPRIRPDLSSDFHQLHPSLGIQEAQHPERLLTQDARRGADVAFDLLAVALDCGGQVALAAQRIRLEIHDLPALLAAPQ